MKRRQFLSASALALATAGTSAAGFAAADSQHEDYTWERYQQALAGGKPFLLDFYASW